MRARSLVPLLAALAAYATVARAEEEPESDNPATAKIRVRHEVTLAECLASAEKNYPKVHESMAQLARMKAQLWEAHVAPYSGFSAWAGVALAPTVAGTAVYSPNTDATITSSMALAWQAGIQGAIPLWTFGKITSVGDAAAAQVK